MLTDKEKEDLTTEVKDCVRDIVRKELPVSLVQELAPMVRRTSVSVLKRYRRLAMVGWALSAIAIAILFYRVNQQSDQNTKVNHKQDCVLVGLIVGIQSSDHDPGRNILYHQVIRSLTSPGRCGIKVLQPH